MFKIKRIYETPKETDGFRILIDRLWPRGVSKEKAKVKLWLKDIAPSYALIKDFHTNNNWALFKKKYKEELKQKTDIVSKIKGYEKKEGTVTLIFSAKDEEKNQAVILRDFLQKR